MLKNIAHYDIILASQSPRRRELLKGLDIDFRIEVIDVDESYPNGMMGVEIPMYLAEKKANAYRSIMQDNTLLITADTIVWHEGRVMNKPANEAEARQMLTKLSGKTHQVITGVCISSLRKRRVFHVISEVRFARLTDAEIDYYLDNYKPYDKAGSYGVQEWIGFVGVEHINGSYFNVMGLPVQRLYNELKRWAE
ncbi:MAG: Maf-like protein [Paludibacter sp.]|nr:septum formation protein Maf [Paludibacter sp.]MDX9919543.1 Maf-like protein [Paludibacter sp.]